jgi:hypothetical protein
VWCVAQIEQNVSPLRGARAPRAASRLSRRL